MRKKELEKELAHKTEELNTIKEILTKYLDKVYETLDNITPEDLEYKLINTEYEDIPEQLKVSDTFWLNEIVKTCEALGWSHYKEYNVGHNVKFFIKALARENYKLKQMIADKRDNGSSRTNNLGSSDTTNIK